MPLRHSQGRCRPPPGPPSRNTEAAVRGPDRSSYPVRTSKTEPGRSSHGIRLVRPRPPGFTARSIPRVRPRAGRPVARLLVAGQQGRQSAPLLRSREPLLLTSPQPPTFDGRTQSYRRDADGRSVAHVNAAGGAPGRGGGDRVAARNLPSGREDKWNFEPLALQRTAWRPRCRTRIGRTRSRLTQCQRTGPGIWFTTEFRLARIRPLMADRVSPLAEPAGSRSR
jgi:hypothetical protein